jgi:hypothetical protein
MAEDDACRVFSSGLILSQFRLSLSRLAFCSAFLVFARRNTFEVHFKGIT